MWSHVCEQSPCHTRRTGGRAIKIASSSGGSPPRWIFLRWSPTDFWAKIGASVPSTRTSERKETKSNLRPVGVRWMWTSQYWRKAFPFFVEVRCSACSFSRITVVGSAIVAIHSSSLVHWLVTWMPMESATHFISVPWLPLHACVGILGIKIR